MNTDQILSFEEFSTRGTDTATAEAPTTDTATVDTVVTDTETKDIDTEETTESEETTVTEETEEEETKATEEPKDVKVEVEELTVAEMYKKIGEACQKEAMAYDADDYAEHTKDTYITEMAALAAETTCNAIQEMYGEKGTKEQFEATCNSVREAYAKKCNEACEAYGTFEDERPESENEPVQGPENSIISKEEK